jgi:prepilin-type N-terminal cleavage/methylation domain-containing protein
MTFAATIQVRTAIRRGFTLAESLVSMSVIVVLVGGLVSAIVLSTRALPANAAERESVRQVDTAAGQIVEEMRSAVWFIERSTRRVTFTVPDRDSDGVPERICYSWSGAAGSDLLRSVNGGTEAAFLSNVGSFAISYETAAETETFVGAPIESADTVLRSYRASSVANALLTTTAWWGEYFQPTLPADALSWKVKQVSIYAAKNGNDNGTTASTRWNCGTPTARIFRLEPRWPRSRFSNPISRVRISGSVSRSPESVACRRQRECAWSFAACLERTRSAFSSISLRA